MDNGEIRFGKASVAKYLIHSEKCAKEMPYSLDQIKAFSLVTLGDKELSTYLNRSILSILLLLPHYQSFFL